MPCATQHAPSPRLSVTTNLLTPAMAGLLSRIERVERRPFHAMTPHEARAAYDNYPKSALVRLMPQGTTDGLARRVRRAVERRSPRVIYPSAYVMARHFPGITRWLMDRFAPLALPPREG